MKSTISYFADEKQYPLFFTENLLATVARLQKALLKIAPNTLINIYPDATLKANKLPTGAACLAPVADAILLPFLLRDPGCGYLMFKICLTGKVSADWSKEMGGLLEEITCGRSSLFQRIKHKILDRVGFTNIIHHGLDALKPVLALDSSGHFNHKQFNAGNLQLAVGELEMLEQDFMQLTNTIEIRKIDKIQQPDILTDYAIDTQDYIGFIHSGSDLFPLILGKKFVYNICEYADKNELFDLEDIKDGIVGVPLHSDLGKEYEAWLYAAMNYALVSRYCLYEVIKSTIESAFPCKVSLINDNCHAGIFKQNKDNKTVMCSTRGIQSIQTHQLCLLAGQRETIAALVVGGKKAEYYGNWFSHGTGYHICPEFNYSSSFSDVDKQHYLEKARAAFYNSTPIFEQCLPLTYNLLSALEFFEKIELAQTVAYLSPLVNIHCERLKN